MFVSGTSGCSFEGLLASCHLTVGGIPIQASARINHCHNPIDITFLLQSGQDLTVEKKEPHFVDPGIIAICLYSISTMGADTTQSVGSTPT